MSEYMNVYKFTAESNKTGGPFDVICFGLTWDDAMKKYLHKYPHNEFNLTSVNLVAQPKEVIQ